MTPDARYLIDAFRGSRSLRIDLLSKRTGWDDDFFLWVTAAAVRGGLLDWDSENCVLCVNVEAVRRAERRAA